MNLPKLNFPENYNFKFKKGKEVFFIYDIIRNKFVHLTPEEWVRQHWIHFFYYNKKKSKTQFLIEKKIDLNGTTKRIGILINKKDNPFILVECKAADVVVNESVLNQIMRYNSVLKAEQIIISNGIDHQFYTYDKKENNYKQIENILL